MIGILAVRHIDPNPTVYFFARVRRNLDSLQVERFVSQGRDLLAGSGAIELPTMIATPDDLPVECSFRQGYTSMRAVVSKREWSSVRVPSKGNLFSQNFFRPKPPLPEFSAV